MKINKLKNRGFTKLSVLAVILILAAALLSVSCSGSENNNKSEVKEIEKSIEEIKDSSMEFSGNIAQTTCLECHPEVKDGGIDIDFTKVKTSSVAHSNNNDLKKMETEKSGKKD